MNIENNIPAFPIESNDGRVFETGMTLLDYFAAKAMQGFIKLINDNR